MLKNLLPKQSQSKQLALIFILGVVVFFVLIWLIRQFLLEKQEITLEFNFDNQGSIEEITGRPFSENDKTLLTKNGFLIRPTSDIFYQQDPESFANRQDDWTHLYLKIGGKDICQRASGNSVYITSDANLHFYHRLFEMEMEYLEDTQFLPLLKQMTDNLLTQTLKDIRDTSDQDKKASLERLSAYLAVPAAILNSTDLTLPKYGRTPAGFFTQLDHTLVQTNLEKINQQLAPTAVNTTTAELDKVLQAQSLGLSMINQQDHDYTQYQPRGHYNKNSLGQAYFIAMAWYGRNGFALKSPDEIKNLTQTYDAINLIQLLENTKEVATWQKLKEPIDYLVGNTDDLTVTDYLPFINSDFKFSDLPSLINQLQGLKKPQIMSSVIFDAQIGGASKQEVQDGTQAFQLFSQRFTPDAYIFTNLTQGEEAPDSTTGERLPSTPTALMVPAVLGDSYAQKELATWINQEAPNSKKILAQEMNKLSAEFKTWNQEKWQSNNYQSWLYTLSGLNQGQKPSLVIDKAWAAKNLNAYLGSYTELKHDTILYAKQSYAEKGNGGGCEPPAVPYGWVEQNQEFFSRLVTLVNNNRNWLIDSGLLAQDDPLIWRFDSYLETLGLYQEIITSQMTETKLSDEKYEELRVSFAYLDGLLMPLFDIQSEEKDVRSALIADVATDVVSNQILYEANAIPDEVILAIDDHNGQRLVRGLTYSYREFAGPLAKRETDQTWQANVYQPNANLPPQPNWWLPYQAQ